jgi:hypothetical protein
MPTSREEAISKFFDLIVSQVQTSTLKIYRNKEESLHVPDAGVINIRDGDSTPPVDTFLSPQRFVFEHIIDMSIIVRDYKESSRDTELDNILLSIDNAIVSDRTLGGTVDWCEAQSPDLSTENESGQIFKIAILPVMIRFTTNTAIN